MDTSLKRHMHMTSQTFIAARWSKALGAQLGKGPAGSCKYHICIAQFHREQLAGPIITLVRDKKESGSTSVSVTKAGPGPAVALNLIGSNLQGPAATH